MHKTHEVDHHKSHRKETALGCLTYVAWGAISGCMSPKLQKLVTAATRALRQAKVDFVLHPYTYESRGGTRVSSRALGVDEHAVIKTLIMEDDAETPLVILMHGDLEVDTKALARMLGAKKVRPCSTPVAEKRTGYLVGGTSPFGLRTPLPIYAEASICNLERLYINAGKRGALLSLLPKDLERVLNPTWVSVGRASSKASKEGPQSSRR